MKHKETVQCADIVARFGDKFVIIERLSFPLGLALPGGKVDPGETPEVTARREFFEETGLALVILGEVGFYDDPGRDPRGPSVSTVFHGEAFGTPQAEVGKTKVFLLTKHEVESRGAEFVADHFSMFCDYVKQNCS